MKILHATRPPGEIPTLEVVLDGFVGRTMFRHGWAGTTIPLPFFVLILYYTGPDPLVRIHEHEHVEQREALGLFGFWFNYCRGAFKGYAANPMEIDAYAVEAEAQMSGLPDWAK